MSESISTHIKTSFIPKYAIATHVTVCDCSFNFVRLSVVVPRFFFLQEISVFHLLPLNVSGTVSNLKNSLSALKMPFIKVNSKKMLEKAHNLSGFYSG